MCEDIQDKLSLLHSCSTLGQCYSSLSNWSKAVEVYARQLNTALSISDLQTAVIASSSRGQCYTNMKEHAQAVSCHRRAVLYAQRIGDKLSEAKEHCYTGCALISVGRPQQSLVHLQEHLQLSRELGETDEEKRALSNLSQSYFMIGAYQESFSFSRSLLTLSTQSFDQAMTTRAYAGMGKAQQAMENCEEAIRLFTEQLKHSKDISDLVPQTKALANLAYAYEANGDNSMSLKYGYDLLGVSQSLGLTSLQAKAYGILGKNYSSLGSFSEALQFYRLQVGLRHAVNNPNLHLSTLCELASCYADTGDIISAKENFERAVRFAETENCSKEMLCHTLEHYGRFQCVNAMYSDALTRLECCLEMTAASSQAMTVRRRVCRELAVCYEALGNLEAAVCFYKELFRRGKDEGERDLMLEALERLQSIYQTLGDSAQAAVYENKRQVLEIESLSLASSSPSRSVSIAELARRGDSFIEKGQLQEACQCFEDLLDKARAEEQPLLEGVACAGLARIYQKKGEFQEAIFHLKNDVLIRRTLHDLSGEVSSLERLGDLCSEGEMLSDALTHYENQLEVARQAKAGMGEVRALGKLGRVLVRLSRLEDALGYYNEQLAIYTNNVSIGEVQDQAECCAHLGDIHLRMDNLPEALSCHTKHLALVQQLGQPRLQIRAYGSIGQVHFRMGQHDDALMCYERKQRLSRKVESQAEELEVYGEMAAVYISTEGWTHAVSCYRHQKDLARRMLEADPGCVDAKRGLYHALSGLSDMYFQQEVYNKALENQHKGLEVANQLGGEEEKMRANGSLAEIHEKMRNFNEAINFRVTHLQLARNLRDSSHIASGLLGLGRCQFYRCEFSQAAAALREAVAEGYTCDRRGLEARVRYYLGLVSLHLGEMEVAESSLRTAQPLIAGLVSESLLNQQQLVELLHIQENLYLGLELALAALDRPLEALVAADCKKHTGFLKHVIYKHNASPEVLKSAGFFHQPLISQDVSKLVKRLTQTTLVYSVAYIKLHVWVLREGLVQFKQVDLSEATPTQRHVHFSSLSSLSSLSGESFLFSDFYPGLAETISQLRESLGVSILFSSKKMPLSPVLPFTPLSCNSDSETESVSRSSLSSGSSKRSVSSSVEYQPSTEVLVARLHSLLIEPVEQSLPSPHRQESLTLILDRELYLVPFSLLAPRNPAHPALLRAYKLQSTFSLQVLLQQHSLLSPFRKREMLQWTTIHSSSKKDNASQFLLLRNITRDLDLPEDYSVMLAQRPSSPLVVASPHFLCLDGSTGERTWYMKPAAEKEARRLGGILKVKPVLRNKAIRDKVAEQLQTTNCVFYSGQVSWEKQELVLIAKSFASRSDNKMDREESVGLDRLSLKERGRGDGESDGDESRSERDEYHTISYEGLLAYNLDKLKLFAFSGHCLPSDSELDINDLLSLALVLFSAGVKSVLLPLWTVPDNSGRTFLTSLFNSLAKGGGMATAFQKAMRGVQDFSSFSHPVNWAGHLLLGSDVTLQEMNPTPHFQRLILNSSDETKNALNFLKEFMLEAESLVLEGNTSPNVVPQANIEAEFASSEGCKELLKCAGFVFNAGIPPDIPDCLVYPSKDESHSLHTCLSFVASLLEMDQYMLEYLRNMKNREILIYPLLRLLKLSLFQLPSPGTESKRRESDTITVGTEMYVWNVLPCQEMLKYIGYRLKSVSATDVQLQIQKQNLTHSYLKSIISCLHALFGPEEQLPRIVFDSHSTEETL